MLEKYAFGFYEVISTLENLRHKASLLTYSSYAAKREVDTIDLAQINKSLVDMHRECEILNIVSTADLISFMQSEIRRKRSDYSYNDLLKDVETLSFSFANELRKRFFFRIPDSKQSYFQKDNLFGLEVSTAFPSCVDEIQRAGSCFALELWDASVFHLMRTLERALHTLAIKFSVPFVHSTWHTVIEQIEKKVRKMDSSFGADWKDKQKFYSEAASQFMFLKEAWRNYVMHVGDVYDEGKALSVLTHVRVVMKALAKGGLAEEP